MQIKAISYTEKSTKFLYIRAEEIVILTIKPY